MTAKKVAFWGASVLTALTLAGLIVSAALAADDARRALETTTKNVEVISKWVVENQKVDDKQDRNAKALLWCSKREPVIPPHECLQEK